jgi:hypothetical protein
MLLSHLSYLSMAFSCSSEITYSFGAQLVSFSKFFVCDSFDVSFAWMVHPFAGGVLVVIGFLLDVYWNSEINGLFPSAWSPASKISQN